MRIARSLVPFATVALLAGLTACGSSSSDGGPVTPPGDSNIVRPADIGDTWLTNDTRDGGGVQIVSGAETAPFFGEGCLEITTTDSTSGGSGAAKAQLYHYTWASQGQADAGTRLDELTALGYWARRDGTSTNNAAQAVSLNVEVDYVGDGSSYTTLVFEPVYNTYQQAQADDAWQYWDAIDGGNAVWWSSRAIPGVCAGSCFVTWNDILTANPDARIVWGVGFNCGSGWSGDFRGLVDGLTVGVNGETRTFDFEPAN